MRSAIKSCLAPFAAISGIGDDEPLRLKAGFNALRRVIVRTRKLERGTQIWKLAIHALCLVLVAGSASAQQQAQHRNPASEAASHKLSISSRPMNASPQQLNAEEAFFYFAAIFGTQGDIADRYASYFDVANYKQAMANEFSRAQYKRTMQAKVDAELKRIDFGREFTITGQAMLGEYSFTNHSFPVSGGGHALFCIDAARTFFGNCQGSILHVEAFAVPNAVNSADFDWLLTMPETEASAFIRSRTIGTNGGVNRTVFTRITYSILGIRGKTEGVGGLPATFKVYIHAVEVFSDGSLSRKLGTLTKRPGIPESAYSPEAIRAATSPTKTIGTYKYIPVQNGDWQSVVNGVRKPRVTGTVTLTDVGVTLSGEQLDGSTKPVGMSFYDSFDATRSEHRHDPKVMRLLRSDLDRSLYQYNDLRVIWDAFSNYPEQSPLFFDNRMERDRLFVDLTRAMQGWASEISAICGDTFGRGSTLSGYGRLFGDVPGWARTGRQRRRPNAASRCGLCTRDCRMYRGGANSAFALALGVCCKPAEGVLDSLACSSRKRF